MLHESNDHLDGLLIKDSFSPAIQARRVDAEPARKPPLCEGMALALESVTPGRNC